MMNFDLMKYGTHALIGMAGIYAYDSLIDKKDNAFIMQDVYAIGITAVVSDISVEVITGFLPYLNNKSLPSMLLTPVLNGIVYMYLYNYMVGKLFIGNRSSSKAFFVGSLVSLFTSYLENPIASLFGYRNY